MTKVRKAERAKAMLAMLDKGPIFHAWGGQKFTPEEADAQYRRWFQSWVENDLLQLVPELKHLHKPISGGRVDQ